MKWETYHLTTKTILSICMWWDLKKNCYLAISIQDSSYCFKNLVGAHCPFGKLHKLHKHHCITLIQTHTYMYGKWKLVNNLTWKVKEPTNLNIWPPTFLAFTGRTFIKHFARHRSIDTTCFTLSHLALVAWRISHNTLLFFIYSIEFEIQNIVINYTGKPSNEWDTQGWCDKFL